MTAAILDDPIGWLAEQVKPHVPLGAGQCKHYRRSRISPRCMGRRPTGRDFVGAIAAPKAGRIGRRVVTKQFTASTTFIVPAGVYWIEAVVVGGGGGGNGGGSGNGGGGGAVHEAGIAVTPGQSIVVTIGAGGAGGPSAGNGNGSKGSASAFGALGALGGGGAPYGYQGDWQNVTGINPTLVAIVGANGGGGANPQSIATTMIGYPGVLCTGPTSGGQNGSGYTGGTTLSTAVAGSGGAGAGGNGVATPNTTTGGAGGPGATTWAGVFGGGGGGGGNAADGAGGTGGGGKGKGATAGADGTANTGGGGGGVYGAAQAGYNGGSGVVWIRYFLG